jgi:hypothetical protein
MSFSYSMCRAAGLLEKARFQRRQGLGWSLDDGLATSPAGGAGRIDRTIQLALKPLRFHLCQHVRA